MRKKIALIITALLLSACSTEKDQQVSEPVKTPDTAAVQAEKFAEADSWTAAVLCDYEMTFENGDKAEYQMDGLLEADEKAEEAHLFQTFHADGDVSSTLSGWYYGGKLYAVYNGVEYYDELSMKDVKDLMLVPLGGALMPSDETDSVSREMKDGDEIRTITLNEKGRDRWFTKYYDFYGVSEAKQKSVSSGVIVQRVSEDGFLLREEADFTVKTVISGLDTDIAYHSEISFENVNSTEIGLNDQVKEMTAAYPHYSEIDTEAIAEGSSAEEYDSVEDMLKDRLVRQLGYTLQEDGTYMTEFNENESYRFDFENRQFVYRNHTSTYVYNWRGDVGGFGSSCSYDFVSEKAGSSCTDDVLDMIRSVKLYCQMELYYCGILLEDLTAETMS